MNHLNQKNWENDYWTTQAPVFNQPVDTQSLQADMGDW